MWFLLISTPTACVQRSDEDTWWAFYPYSIAQIFNKFIQPAQARHFSTLALGQPSWCLPHVLPGIHSSSASQLKYSPPIKNGQWKKRYLKCIRARAGLNGRLLWPSVLLLHCVFASVFWRQIVQLIQSPDTEEFAANERFNQANKAARKPEVWTISVSIANLLAPAVHNQWWTFYWHCEMESSIMLLSTILFHMNSRRSKYTQTDV